MRNGTRPKTVLTEATGQVMIEVPRDRDSRSSQWTPEQRQRRLTGLDEARAERDAITFTDRRPRKPTNENAKNVVSEADPRGAIGRVVDAPIVSA
ncbi:hypothetical protein GCM10011399_38110 [Subtercola lobariae]|uniref:Transposase n=1 Tax=Subtercola lobariae TaxID=1588641 RepID=A0A917F4G0_9MICO|nr:hypothetical protein GCM10011399_38110 [Subtercola lobariae]